jgi:hypothetical protein
MGRSKCGSHLLMIIYKIQANHDAIGKDQTRFRKAQFREED